MLTDLKKNLEAPTLVPISEKKKKSGSRTQGKVVVKSRNKGIISKSTDPISKVLKANDRAYKFHKEMNNLLLKILERYEIDKPILMQDKLDIIWDKAEKKADPDHLAEKKEYDPEAEFEKELAESLLTADEAKKKREAIERAEIDA